MSRYYSQRVSPLLNLYDKLTAICASHVAISQASFGDLEQMMREENTYPMVYLETITEIQENSRKNGEAYSIALNILDREVTDGNSRSRILLHDKLKQIFTEIKAYLEQKQVFGEPNVSPAAILLFNDFEDDRLVRLRGEFTIEVDSLVTSVPDFTTLFLHD